MNLLQAFQPVAFEASDGKLFASPGAAFLHDLIERRWAQLLPTLTDGHVVRQARIQLRVTQTELARQAEISQCYLAQIESGKRRMSEDLAQKIWSALWRFNQERKNAPAAMEMLVRLENDLAVITYQERL